MPPPLPPRPGAPRRPGAAGSSDGTTATDAATRAVDIASAKQDALRAAQIAAEAEAARDPKELVQERLAEKKRKLAEARARIESRISTSMGAAPPAAAASGGAMPVRSPTGSVWPWVQGQEGDGRQLRKELRNAMEEAKRNDLRSANETIDRIGPHLGEHLDLLFHVGVLLRKLDREEDLRMMLEEANRRYPDDPKVVAALSGLGG